LGRSVFLLAVVGLSGRGAGSLPSGSEGGGLRRGSRSERRDQARGRAGIPASRSLVAAEGLTPTKDLQPAAPAAARSRASEGDVSRGRGPGSRGDRGLRTTTLFSRSPREEVRVRSSLGAKRFLLAVVGLSGRGAGSLPSGSEGGGLRRGSRSERRDQASGRAGIPASRSLVAAEGLTPTKDLQPAAPAAARSRASEGDVSSTGKSGCIARSRGRRPSRASSGCGRAAGSC